MPATTPKSAARCAFVVVGAGYTGTESAAQGLLSPGPRCAVTRGSARTSSGRCGRPRPGHPARAGPAARDPALRILRRRGLDVRLNTTSRATDSQVRLSDGTTVHPHANLVRRRHTRPLTQALGLETVKERIMVDEFPTSRPPGCLRRRRRGRTPTSPVPDTHRDDRPARPAPGQGRGAQCRRHPRPGTRQPYKHRDLGFVVDLDGSQAVADPCTFRYRPPGQSRPPRLPPLRPARQQAGSLPTG